MSWARLSAVAGAADDRHRDSRLLHLAALEPRACCLLPAGDKEAMIQVEYAYYHVTAEAMATKGLTEAWNGTGWRHVKNKLIAHWREESYDELLPFSFIELPEAGNEVYA